jgi:hypothetical protein
MPTLDTSVERVQQQGQDTAAVRPPREPQSQSIPHTEKCWFPRTFFFFSANLFQTDNMYPIREYISLVLFLTVMITDTEAHGKN